MAYTRRAFSLVEMAIVLAVTGIIAGFILKVTDASTTQDCYVATKAQLGQVREAIERFAVAKDRFPMPARRNLGMDDPFYGREATTPAQIAQLDTNSGVTFGALPFQALGIPVASAADCWGNKLTYVVTTDLTDPAKFLVASTPGAISINKDNSTVFLAEAGYAIISHGADQLGAVKNNYSGADHKWCPPDAAQIRTQNCDVVNTILISTQFNDGKDAAANFFDDVIVYRGKPWRTAMPLVNGVCGASAHTCAANGGTPTSVGFQACADTPDVNEYYTWTCTGSGGGTSENCHLATGQPCHGCVGSEIGPREEMCTAQGMIPQGMWGAPCSTKGDEGGIYYSANCANSYEPCLPACTQGNGSPGVMWQKYRYVCWSCW